MGYDNVRFNAVSFGGGGSSSSSSFSKRKSEQLAQDRFEETKRRNAYNEQIAREALVNQNSRLAAQDSRNATDFQNRQTEFGQGQTDRARTENILAATGAANMAPAYRTSKEYDTKQYTPEIIKDMYAARDNESRDLDIGVNNPRVMDLNEELMAMDIVENPDKIENLSELDKTLKDSQTPWYESVSNALSFGDTEDPNSKMMKDAEREIYNRYVSDRSDIEKELVKEYSGTIKDQRAGLPLTFEQLTEVDKAVPVSELMNNRTKLFREGLQTATDSKGKKLTKKEKDILVGQFKGSKDFQDIKNEQIARRKLEKETDAKREVANRETQAKAILEGKKIVLKAEEEAKTIKQKEKAAAAKADFSALTEMYKEGYFDNPKEYREAVRMSATNGI